MGQQALGPPLVQLEWCDILQHMHVSFTHKDLSDPAGRVAATNSKTKTNGRRGSALLDMTKAKEPRADNY